MDGDGVEWRDDQLVYSCKFGELPIFNLKFYGFRSEPNIFQVDAQEPVPPAGKPSKPSQAYSLPCDERLTPKVIVRSGYIHHVYSVYKHYYVDTSGVFSDYMGRFKGKSLNGLKRKLNKVEKSNKQVSFRKFHAADDIDEFLVLAKNISEKSYQERLLGRELPTSEKFKSELVEMANANRFRGYILYAEDRPIAYNLCPVYGDGIKLYDYSGYDPEYEQYSAGTVLQYKIIEECFADPTIKIYDLCTGEGRHKEFFATGYKTCCDVFYFPATPYYIFVVYARAGIEGFAKKTISLLEKAGVKSRIKKFIRRLR